MILRAASLILLAGLHACCLARAGVSGDVTWRSIGPAEFGSMFGVAIAPHNPKMIVAGLDMGNAFLTRDGGKSWKTLGRNGGETPANPAYRGVWGVCFDPKRPGRIFIGSTHGLFRSLDQGENWRMLFGGGPEYTTHAEENLPGGILRDAKPGIECRSICDLALLPGRGRAALLATIALRYLKGEKGGWFGGV